MTLKRVAFCCAAVLFAVLVRVAAFEAGPNFRGDVVFKGSTLSGWRTLGQATWKAENGSITGTPTQPGGGWLVLDKSYEDVGVYANLQ
jgi:hypothetical protein